MNPAPQSSWACLLFIALAGSSAGRAATPEPRFVRAADLGTLGPLRPGQPLVIEFQEGDIIPPISRSTDPL